MAAGRRKRPTAHAGAVTPTQMTYVIHSNEVYYTRYLMIFQYAGSVVRPVPV